MSIGPLVPPDPLGGTIVPRIRRAAALAARSPEIQKVARDFESVLLQKVMEEMHRTVPDSGGAFESGTTEQVWSLFWFYLAQDAADKGGLGLWKELARELSRAAAENPAATLAAEPRPSAGGAVSEPRPSAGGAASEPRPSGSGAVKEHP